MQKWFVFSLLFSAVVVLFAVLNAEVIIIHLFGVNIQLSESLIIIGSAALGAIITIFLGVFSKINYSMKIHTLNAELENANARIGTLNDSLRSHEQKEAVQAAQTVQPAKAS